MHYTACGYQSKAGGERLAQSQNHCKGEHATSKYETKKQCGQSTCKHKIESLCDQVTCKHSQKIQQHRKSPPTFIQDQTTDVLSSILDCSKALTHMNPIMILLEELKGFYSFSKDSSKNMIIGNGLNDANSNKDLKNQEMSTCSTNIGDGVLSGDPKRQEGDEECLIVDNRGEGGGDNGSGSDGDDSGENGGYDDDVKNVCDDGGDDDASHDGYTGYRYSDNTSDGAYDVSTGYDHSGWNADGQFSEDGDGIGCHDGRVYGSSGFEAVCFESDNSERSYRKSSVKKEKNTEQSLGLDDDEEEEEEDHQSNTQNVSWPDQCSYDDDAVEKLSTRIVQEMQSLKDDNECFPHSAYLFMDACVTYTTTPKVILKTNRRGWKNMKELSPNRSEITAVSSSKSESPVVASEEAFTESFLKSNQRQNSVNNALEENVDYIAMVQDVKPILKGESSLAYNYTKSPPAVNLQIYKAESMSIKKFSTLKARMKTFVVYQSKWMAATSLAKAGFISFKHGDAVHCVWCCLKLKDFTETVDAFAIHQLHSSDCCEYLKRVGVQEFHNLALLFPTYDFGKHIGLQIFSCIYVIQKNFASTLVAIA